MRSLESIQKEQERKRNLHRSFLKDLSTTLLPKLFFELGIENYKIKEKFIEPRSAPPFREEISPDLVIAYTNPNLNLLLVEAKLSANFRAQKDLEEETSLLRSYASEEAETLYEILRQKIPLEILQSCGICSIGVFRTKSGNFKIYKTERLR